MGGDYYAWMIYIHMSLMAELNKMTKVYYISIQNSSDADTCVMLTNELIHRTYYCKDKSQKICIYIHLLTPFQWYTFEDIIPHFHHIKSKGNPGTGTHFVIQTMRNITAPVIKINNYDIVSAPT